MLDCVRLGERSLLERVRGAEHALFMLSQNEAGVARHVTEMRRRSLDLDDEKSRDLARRMRRAARLREESARVMDEAKAALARLQVDGWLMADKQTIVDPRYEHAAHAIAGFVKLRETEKVRSTRLSAALAVAQHELATVKDDLQHEARAAESAQLQADVHNAERDLRTARMTDAIVASVLKKHEALVLDALGSSLDEFGPGAAGSAPPPKRLESAVAFLKKRVNELGAKFNALEEEVEHDHDLIEHGALEHAAERSPAPKRRGQGGSAADAGAIFEVRHQLRALQQASAKAETRLSMKADGFMLTDVLTRLNSLADAEASGSADAKRLARDCGHLRDAFPRLVKWTKDYVDRRLGDFEDLAATQRIDAEVDGEPTLRITGANMDQGCTIASPLDAHAALHAAAMAPFRPASAAATARARSPARHLEAPDAMPLDDGRRHPARRLKAAPGPRPASASPDVAAPPGVVERAKLGKRPATSGGDKKRPNPRSPAAVAGNRPPPRSATPPAEKKRDDLDPSRLAGYDDRHVAHLDRGSPAASTVFSAVSHPPASQLILIPGPGDSQDDADPRSPPPRMSYGDGNALEPPTPHSPTPSSWTPQTRGGGAP